MNDIFKKVWKSDIKSSDLETQIELGKELLSSEYFECKYIGINLFSKIHKKLDKNFLENDVPYILTNHCNEWATWYYFIFILDFVLI